MKELLKFVPVRKDPVWGSEYWTVSAHPSGDCRVAEGTYAGMKLSELWEAHRELFGNTEGDRFPLLVKVIDAKKDLSIQVHPDNAYANEHENGSLGKSECWYIMEAGRDGRLALGHHAKSRAQADEWIKAGRWDDFIRYIPVETGEFIQIDPGTVHSICGGIKLTEIQQNSDITYRLYDYGRLVDGKERPLHIRESLDVIGIPDKSGENIFHDFPVNGHKTPYYQVRKHVIETQCELEQTEAFQIISAVKGSGEIDGVTIREGESLIVPCGYGTYRITGQTEILITSL